MRSLGRLACMVLASALLLQGCAGRHSGGSIPRADPFAMVKSVSPASVPVRPMARTPILPPSAMASIRLPRAAIHPASFTQLPGGAISVAASPDGSVWVLSSRGNGPDRAIWHYVNGAWTNTPGAAMRISVGPDNLPWAINSAGGIYSYDGSTWNARFGGASDISVGPDGSVYVISNVGDSQYGRGIWHLTGGPGNGVWTQLPGAAVRVAASWDTGTYPTGVGPGGVYVVNAVNDIYYRNPGSAYIQIPGKAIQVAPTTSSGGVFALGTVPNDDGASPISYLDLASGNWAAQQGAAVSIATNGANVYAIGAAGGIYTAPIRTYWTTKTPMTTAQGGTAGAVIANIFYVMGGYGSGPTDYQLATLEAYDPSANAWTAKAPMPTARYGVGVGVVNNVLYAVGGGNQTSNVYNTLGTVEAYDPGTNAWTTKAAMPTVRSYVTVAVVNNILYAIGGSNASFHAINTVEAYDPASNTWTAKASLPVVLTSAGAGVVNNVIYVAGGETTPASATTTVYAYDPAANTWSTKAPMHAGHIAPAAGVINNILYVAGGFDSVSPVTVTNSVEAFDPVANTWATVAAMPTARNGAAAGVINNALYVAGGADSSSTAIKTLEAFSP